MDDNSYSINKFSSQISTLVRRMTNNNTSDTDSIKYQTIRTNDLTQASMQGSQGTQLEEVEYDTWSYLGKPAAFSTQLLMQVNLGCFLKFCLPFFFKERSQTFAVAYTLAVVILHMGSVYTHLKIWITEPGYPERVSTQ